MAISDTKLRSLHGKPYSGPQEISDQDGLSARISPKGVIKFQYRYRWQGKPQRLGIGRYPAISLKDARNIISELILLYEAGTDPKTYFDSASGNSVMTVGDCIAYWKTQYVDVALRPKTQALYESTVVKHLSGVFPGRAISDINVKQWVDFFA